MACFNTTRTLYFYIGHKCEVKNMSVNAVSGKNGVTSTQKTAGLHEENGKMVVNFQGKKYTLTKKQVEQYNEALYNVNYARNRIDSLKHKLAAKDLSTEDRQKYSTELKNLQAVYAKQQETANFEISPTGEVVSFTMKKDIPAEAFKELFYIEDGALRSDLKKEALADGIGVEKDASGERLNLPYASYDDAMFGSGVSSFSNGVFLEYIDDAGHYQPVYSKAVLYSGNTYSVSSSAIDPYKDAPWYTKLFGIGKED